MIRPEDLLVLKKRFSGVPVVRTGDESSPGADRRLENDGVAHCFNGRQG